ncbi:hypothetical protein M3204_04995 [Mesobacillus subterraneus]|uniref:hypothetical protein n=1 Tax=Mesobacillus subterraneus TaxID=285983 RepID=UPI00203E4493|nr:hypothetical protein [Mesobacillus subterraneus]MCM3663748.1 hypothetical protein [Mesobacillus subterraneus]MCM3683509.1 hypothetical protein [Mesobacillus subterraneus]
MLVAIMITGVVTGLLAGTALKFFRTGYGFANDIDNKPLLLKSCMHCGQRIQRTYTKNLCPSCSKPLE